MAKKSPLRVSSKFTGVRPDTTRKSSKTKMNNLYFESPRGTLAPQKQTDSGQLKSDSNMNPLMSPENPLQSSEFQQIEQQDEPINFDQDMDANLRMNYRITEAEEESSLDRSKLQMKHPIKNVTLYHSLAMNQCPPVEMKPMSMSPVVMMRRGTVQMGREMYHSLDRFAFLSRTKLGCGPEEEIQALKKAHREEVAKLTKSKAVLEQQVELLTIQLHEASERERNLKKTYTSMIQALQNKTENEKLRQSTQKSESNQSPVKEQAFGEVQKLHNLEKVAEENKKLKTENEDMI